MENNSNYYKPDEHRGICVVKRKNESEEDLIKRFRKKFAKSGLPKEIRDRLYYEKPCDRRRREKAQSIRLLKKEEEKIEKMRERSKIYKEKQKRKKNFKTKGDNYDKSNR